MKTLKEIVEILNKHNTLEFKQSSFNSGFAITLTFDDGVYQVSVKEFSEQDRIELLRASCDENFSKDSYSRNGIELQLEEGLERLNEFLDQFDV